LERITSDPETQTHSGRPTDLVKINTEDEHGVSLGQQFKVSILSPASAEKMLT
jgi:hypothetical protein